MLSFFWTYLLPSTGLALLAALLWSQRKVRQLEIDLALSRQKVQTLQDIAADAYDVQRQLKKAVAQSEARYRDALKAIAKFTPPEDAAGALMWLNSPEAKG